MTCLDLKYLFNDVYNLSDFQLQFVLVLRLVVKHHLTLPLLGLCGDERRVPKNTS